LINFIIYQNNIVRNGQSIAVGTMRISLIIPTLLSIFIFNETLVFIKYLAILLIIVAFMRLSFMGHIRHIPLALLLFGVTGITDSFMKLYDEFGRDDPGLYLSILFTAALCLTIILIIIKQRRVNIQSILLGFILGIPNQLTTKFFMRSLTQVSATVAYPLLASGVVLFALFTDAGIWRRKFSLRELAAYAVLVAGIVLLNIKW
jgi:drug/metabolite transporter (DMT)-like permease